jgi:hypothetical protein
VVEGELLGLFGAALLMVWVGRAAGPCGNDNQKDKGKS